MISGFSFVHNAIRGGLPIFEAIQAVRGVVDEVVVVDMQSTDGTREALLSRDVKILDGEWSNEAGETLALAHSMNALCRGDIILHFEADEVYDPNLVRHIQDLIDFGYVDIAVYRLQLEANFQRCRWYPELVHRVFPKGTVQKVGHTTDRDEYAQVASTRYGYLWDCANNFRDNWLTRVRQQAFLWNEEPQYRMVSIHDSITFPGTREAAEEQLAEAYWTWTTTPFAIPIVLKPLVGITKYEVII